MRTISAIAQITLACALSACASAPVIDSTRAMELAEQAWVPLYGSERIERQRPYQAKLSGTYWEVSGTLHCPESAPPLSQPDRSLTEVRVCLGGTAYAQIDASTGEVLIVTHLK